MKEEDNHEDWFEKLFNKFSDFFEYLILKNIDVYWFQWLQWVIVSSALFAVWMKTKSIVIGVITLFSVLLIIFRGWVVAREFLKVYLERLSEKQNLKFITIIILVILLSFCPAFITYFLGKLFLTVITD